MFCDWNELTLIQCVTNNWRASLVPAAAVIPAPKAYINVAAVKTLVVGFVHGLGGLSAGLVPPPVYMQNASARLTVWCCCFHAYFEQTNVFHAGACCEYRSMGYYEYMC